MNVTCGDRDSIFEDGTPAQWTALEAHAATCAACAEEVRAWKSLSVAAVELREYSPSPALWSRIETSLAANANTNASLATPPTLQQKISAWFGFSLSWQLAAVGAFAVLLLVSGGLIYRHQSLPQRHPQQQQPVNSAHSTQDSLLKTKALDAVEKAQTAYVQAIDKLASDAKPQLDKPETPLMANYREKLQVIDSAIDDLRAQAGENPSNAHLRYQLLAMYQEKQKTLEDVLEARR
jgi:hypothetical protein